MSTGSSGSGFGGGAGGGSNHPSRGDDPWQAPATRGGEPDDTLAYGAPRTERAERGERGDRDAGGQGRSVSYQPEERYWTDYLRLALPVIGLLLMLGLFLFWLNNLIDDPSGTAPTETVIVGIIPPGSDTIGAGTPTAPVQTAPITTVAVDPAVVATDTVAPGDASAPTTEPVDAGEITEFPVDSSVQVTEDGVNLRNDASIAADALETLSAGDILTITGPPREADDYTWYPVDFDGVPGWVVDEFIAAA
ncbi:MAG: SH3 domain-containing protein [Thermomicrobiales bacterium]